MERSGLFVTVPDASSNAPPSLYELSWKRALDGKMAIDVPSGIIIDCNPAAEALVGLERTQILGRRLDEFVPSHERARVQHELERKSPEPERYENFHLLAADRREIPVVVSTSGVIRLGGQMLAAICEFQDVSVQQQQAHQLATRQWALSAYGAAAVALGHHHSASGLFTAICEAIVTEPMYLFAWVAVANDDPEKTIQLVAEAGPMAGLMDGIELSWSEVHHLGSGPTAIAIRTQILQTVDDTEDGVLLNSWGERVRSYGVRSVAAIPFRMGDGQQRAALVVSARRANAFEAEALSVFTHLAAQLEHGVRAIEQQKQLYAERQHSLDAERRITEAMSRMIESMSHAMEMRDLYTAGHQNRVADLAVAIATEMGWSSERIAGLHLAGQVHDIGKMSIPSEILTKPGRLTRTERSLLQEHSENGYNILKGIPFPWPIATVVHQHHEKLDGSGYPLGLKGDEIIPEARIMIVADMFEAMISHRPYRAGMPVETVLAQLESEAGTQLDAEVVAVCARLCREGCFADILAR